MAGAPKCKGCSKTVYVMDQQVSLPDGAAFHKSCFRCRHCNASLSLKPNKFSSLDGLLYCNPHFQLKMHLLSKDTHTTTTTTTSNNNHNTSLPQPEPQSEPQSQPQSEPQSQPPPPPPPQPQSAAIAKPPLENSKPTPQFTRSPSKAAMMFSGTQDKCVTCTKTVYPLEKVTVEEQAYHKSCFRCSHGGCAISPSNYAALEGVLYCKHHFKQLFKEKGSYNHIMKSASIKRSHPIPSSASDA